MKYLTTVILCLTFITFANAQSLEERVAQETCQYLENVESLEELNDTIGGSIAAAMVDVIEAASDDERKRMSTVEGIREIMEKTHDLIPDYCYNVRRVIIEYKQRQFYGLSANEEANKLFRAGNALMEKGNYKKALKKFKAAIKLDKEFVYAIDHTAICYRQMKDFKKALKYYNQSLEIFPEGDVALLNVAVVYSLMSDWENSLENYDALAFLYPDNPEGYFGLARIQFIVEEYEDALNNLFIAHRMYVETDSDYVADSEKLLAYMMEALEEQGKTDLIYKIAKKHDIEIK